MIQSFEDPSILKPPVWRNSTQAASFYASVAESEYAPGSEPGPGKPLRVRPPPEVLYAGVTETAYVPA